MDRSFTGVERLFGVKGALSIRQSRIAVVGIGGVGSWAAESLARSGVAGLVLIDLDHVAESNINRQVHATLGGLGQAKVLAMRERIHCFAPACDVACVEEFVDERNWPCVLPAKVDAVIDACDQVGAKVAMSAWARHTGTLFVSVGAAGGKRQAHAVHVADLSEVTHDPLLAKVRSRLRKEFAAPRDGLAIGVACVFSREPVARPDVSCGSSASDGSLHCHGYGSLVTVTATFGHSAAGFVLNALGSMSARPHSP